LIEGLAVTAVTAIHAMATQSTASDIFGLFTLSPPLEDFYTYKRHLIESLSSFFNAKKSIFGDFYAVLMSVRVICLVKNMRLLYHNYYYAG
jgi:hypothetical protein